MSQPRVREVGQPNQRVMPQSIGSLGMAQGNFLSHGVEETNETESDVLRNEDALAAGHAHMAADARPVVAAVYDEIVAFGLEADGAVDRLVE